MKKEKQEKKELFAAYEKQLVRVMFGTHMMKKEAGVKQYACLVQYA